ncbi:tropomyosin alpha-1 chain-like [Asparagus officinalis]|uniref:tropomyosin alpha-1 chain-like n=1 Tax=Asparagus officinalis TaxID=4686 RepID=UPI00098DF6BE|nr:tropomyosin alpha-1 chain-like [Asparagus officinalis]
MGFLIRLLGPSATNPYFKRLEEAEQTIRQLLALRTMSFEILHLASGDVQIALEDRNSRLEETTSLDARLTKELERATVENERASPTHQEADSRISRLSLEIAETKQIIANAQALLATQEKAREQVMGELEELGSRRQLAVDAIEEKDRALKEVRHTVQDLLSRSEEDIRREILRRLKLRRAEEIHELYSRLRDL